MSYDLCFYVPALDCSSSRSVKSASLPVELSKTCCNVLKLAAIVLSVPRVVVCVSSLLQLRTGVGVATKKIDCEL